MQYFLITLCLVACLLGGCKLEHNSRIKQSQLMGEIQKIEAVTRIEVGSCRDHSDKTKPSRRLIKANGMMAELFPGAELEECDDKSIKDVARYITALEVGTIPPGVEMHKPESVSVLRNQHNIVFFFISDRIKDYITNSRKEAMGEDFKLHVSIRMANDTPEKAIIFPYAVFANGIPYAGLDAWNQGLTLEPNESATFTLSDVASEYAIIQGVVPVFTIWDPNKKESMPNTAVKE